VPFLETETKKKADVVGHPEVFDHVGLLANGPSSLYWIALHLVFRPTSHNGAIIGLIARSVLLSYGWEPERQAEVPSDIDRSPPIALFVS
jgi:hypothetical protein